MSDWCAVMNDVDHEAVQEFRERCKFELPFSSEYLYINFENTYTFAWCRVYVLRKRLREDLEKDIENLYKCVYRILLKIKKLILNKWKING